MGQGLELAFWWIAILCTVLFGLKTLMMLIGLGGGEDMDAGLEFEDTDSGDSTAAFTLLSLQTLSAFGMGAGWMGLVALPASTGSFRPPGRRRRSVRPASGWPLMGVIRREA